MGGVAAGRLSVKQIVAMIGAVITVALVAKYHPQLRAYFGTKNGGAPPASKEGFQLSTSQDVGIGLVVGAVVLVTAVGVAFAYDESKKKGRGGSSTVSDTVSYITRHPLEGTGRGSRRKAGSRSRRPGSRSRGASRRAPIVLAASSPPKRLSPIREEPSSPRRSGSRAPPSSPAGSPRD